MRTKQFCELLEAAMAEEYEESEFDTVPYMPEGADGGPLTCLGIFLNEGVHMAVVSARAMYLIWQDNDAIWNTDQEKDEAMGDFVSIMAGMRVAPYMQWHCAYFPGLTAAQLEPEEPSVEVLLNDDLLHDDARDVCIELREMGKIEGVDMGAELQYVHDRQDEIADYRRNGMRISEVADTVRSLVSVRKGH